jgi:ribose-phosphate pyrophosphokinase
MGQRLPEILNKVLGVRRVLIIEPHSQHQKQYFTPTADEVPAVPLLVNEIQTNHLKQWNRNECVLVFADAGAAKRFEEIPSILGLEQAYIHKMRTDNDESPSVKGVTGNVQGRHCFILDDEILTGNTLIKDAILLKSHGAASVHMFAVHGILADRKCTQAELIKRLFDAPVDEIVVTDTVPIGNKAAISDGKMRVLEIAPLLGEACKRMILGESLSELHKFGIVDELSVVDIGEGLFG